MFDVLVDLSVSLLSVIPKVYDILSKDFLTFVYDLGADFNLPTSVTQMLYDFVEGVFGSWFETLGLPLDSTPMITVVLVVGISLSIAFAFIIFILDVVDRVIPV